MEELKVEYWSNGEMQSNGQYKDDKEFGCHRGWSPLGVLIYEYAFHDGMFHGILRDIDYDILEYWIYDKEVTEEEWREFELTEKLAGI